MKAINVFLRVTCPLWLAMFAAAQTEATYSADWCRHLPRPEYRALERLEAGSDWFQVYRVRPGVFAIYESQQAEEVISYLIVGSKRALLFDTGMGIAPIRPVVQRLTRLPITVLNSHTHYDHIGGNHEFSNVLLFDSAFSRERSSQGYFDPVMRSEVNKENLCGDLPKDFNPESYGALPFRVTGTVRDGSVIELGRRKLEVLAVPGHTPDSIALLDRQHRLLFTGDTFYVGPIWLFEPETDMAAYVDSVGRLAALADKLDVLLPGHNTAAAPPMYLLKVRDAAQAIVSGHANEASREDGHRKYQFDGFSILTQ